MITMPMMKVLLCKMQNTILFYVMILCLGFHAINKIKSITNYSWNAMIVGQKHCLRFLELRYMLYDMYIYGRHNMKFYDVRFCKSNLILMNTINILGIVIIRDTPFKNFIILSCWVPKCYVNFRVVHFPKSAKK